MDKNFDFPQINIKKGAPMRGRSRGNLTYSKRQKERKPRRPLMPGETEAVILKTASGDLMPGVRRVHPTEGKSEYHGPASRKLTKPRRFTAQLSDVELGALHEFLRRSPEVNTAEDFFIQAVSAYIVQNPFEQSKGMFKSIGDQRNKTLIVRNPFTKKNELAHVRCLDYDPVLKCRTGFKQAQVSFVAPYPLHTEIITYCLDHRISKTVLFHLALIEFLHSHFVELNMSLWHDDIILNQWYAAQSIRYRVRAITTKSRGRSQRGLPGRNLTRVNLSREKVTRADLLAYLDSSVYN